MLNPEDRRELEQVKRDLQCSWRVLQSLRQAHGLDTQCAAIKKSCEVAMRLVISMLVRSAPHTKGNTGPTPRMQRQAAVAAAWCESAEELRSKLATGWTRARLAASLGVNKDHLRDILDVKGVYTVPSDSQLDEFVGAVLVESPSTGQTSMGGQLASRHPEWKVPRARLRESMHRVVPEKEQEKRRIQMRSRSQYVNGKANQVWHIDANLKNIFAGLVVQACVDGHSKICVYVRVVAANTSAATLESFRAGVAVWGAPKRLRTDRGSENVLLVPAMHKLGGFVMQGPSTSNVPIERHWRDMAPIRDVRQMLLQLAGEKLLLHREHQPPTMQLAVWLVYGYHLQRLLLVCQAAWNMHRHSSLKGHQTPKARWMDSMYEQHHNDSKYMDYWAAQDFSFFLQRFEPGRAARQLHLSGTLQRVLAGPAYQRQLKELLAPVYAHKRGKPVGEGALRGVYQALLEELPKMMEDQVAFEGGS